MNPQEKFELACDVLRDSEHVPSPSESEMIVALQTNPAIVYDDRTGMAMLTEECEQMSLNEIRTKLTA